MGTANISLPRISFDNNSCKIISNYHCNTLYFYYVSIDRNVVKTAVLKIVRKYVDTCLVRIIYLIMVFERKLRNLNQKNNTEFNYSFKKAAE